MSLAWYTFNIDIFDKPQPLKILFYMFWDILSN